LGPLNARGVATLVHSRPPRRPSTRQHGSKFRPGFGDAKIIAEPEILLPQIIIFEGDVIEVDLS
jgi:hypothetical protein